MKSPGIVCVGLSTAPIWSGQYSSADAVALEEILGGRDEAADLARLDPGVGVRLPGGLEDHLPVGDVGVMDLKPVVPMPTIATRLTIRSPLYLKVRVKHSIVGPKNGEKDASDCLTNFDMVQSHKTAGACGGASGKSGRLRPVARNLRWPP